MENVKEYLPVSYPYTVPTPHDVVIDTKLPPDQPPPCWYYCIYRSCTCFGDFVSNYPFGFAFCVAFIFFGIPGILLLTDVI